MELVHFPERMLWRRTGTLAARRRSASSSSFLQVLVALSVSTLVLAFWQGLVPCRAFSLVSVLSRGEGPSHQINDGIVKPSPAFRSRCRDSASTVVALRASAGTGASARAPDFEERKEALKRCLAREYRSFFRPFEADFYSDSVTFKDPLNELAGKEKYRKNVEMLSGESLVGNLLFDRGFIDLHSVEEVPGDELRLRTRWTLGFNFKLLPWSPQALFTGVSEYTIDGDARVVAQRDYWDTLSLGDEGAYSAEAGLSGIVDLGAQLLPKALQPEEPPAAVRGDWALLRRADQYRVYRAAKGNPAPFAIAAPGASSSSISDLGRALRNTGLVPAGSLFVDLMSGAVFPAETSSKPQGSVVMGVEVASPHLWDGPPPPE